MDLQIDLLLCSGEYHRLALDRRLAIDLAGFNMTVDVLTCEDLILHKLLAGRVIDLADASALLRLNRSAMDFAYLGEWVKTLQLEGAWQQIQDEAFPEDS